MARRPAAQIARDRPARDRHVDLAAWPALTPEGGLIAPAMLGRIDRHEADHQTPADYALRRGLTLRDEVSTAFRVGQSHHGALTASSTASGAALSPEAARARIADFLRETFGFDDLAPHDGPAAFVAGGRAPIVIVPPGEATLDKRHPALSSDRPRSPAFALQDLLNAEDGFLWGLVTDGAISYLIGTFLIIGQV